MAKRSAVFHASSLEVECPHCGETLPAPCGSLYWTIEELTKAIATEPDRTCDSCDEPFVLRQQNKAHLTFGGYLAPVAATEADHG